MKITLKSIGHELEIKNTGMEFSVRDTNGKHIGDFYVQKAGIVWCGGRTTLAGGKRKTWKKLIESKVEASLKTVSPLLFGGNNTEKDGRVRLLPPQRR